MPSPHAITPLSALSEEYFVGAGHVLPSQHRIVWRDEVVRVTPKVMHVLCCLAANPGTVLRRSDLLDTVWEGTVVTDTVLSRAISELRKVFGDDAAHPRFIETIPKIGYRLIAPVYHGDPREQEAVPAVQPPPLRKRPARIRWVGMGVLVVVVMGMAGMLLTSSGDGDRRSGGPETLRAVPLTTTPGRERQPSFSPEGTRVAYVAGGDLYVRHGQGGEPLRLTDHPAEERSPVWSPDGGTIAFVRYEEDTCFLYEVPTLGGLSRRLAPCDPTVALTIAWSPDGQTLVFPDRVASDSTDTARAPAGLVALDRRTLTRRTLTHPEENTMGDRQPAFSPDGRGLAFVRRVNYWADDLYVLALAEGTLQRVTSDARSISGVDWTPDGGYLVWGSNRKGSYHLWTIALGRDAEPEPLYVMSGGVVNQPQLARQGRRLVYENWSYESNIWRIPGRHAPPDASPALVIGSTMWDLQPGIAPDGQHIALVSTRSGSFELWMQALDGGPARQLTQFEGPFVGVPRWSPDGDFLAFVARTGENASDVVYVLDVERAEAIPITDSTYSSTVPSWNHDGTALYVASNRNGSYQVWRYPLNGADPVRITEEGGAIAFETTDGRMLYYNKPGQSAIWQKPVAGGAEALLLDETMVSFDWWNWLSTDEGFYFFQQDAEGSPAIVYYDRSTRALTPIATAEHLGFSPGIAVSPDEAWLFYTRADRSESDLMLIENFEVDGGEE